MMLRVKLTTVTTLFQIVNSITLTNDVVSGKLLHLQRRLLVFPTGTVMQVRVYIYIYSRLLQARITHAILWL